MLNGNGGVVARLPWQNPKLAVQLAIFYGTSEFLRSGFFVGFFPLFGLERLGLPLSSIGLLTSLHYGAEAFGKVGTVWLSNRFPLGPGLFVSALLAALGYWGMLLGPALAYPVMAAAWGLAMAPIWPRIAAYLSQTARAAHRGRAVTYAWLIVTPMIGLGSFGVGFLTKNHLEWGRLALTAGSLVLPLLGLGLIGLRFPAVAGERKGYVLARFAALLVPAFLQNLAPHLLTTVLFPFLKQAAIGPALLLAAIAVGGATFLALIRPAARFADQRDPALIVALSALLAAIAFAGLALANPARALLVVAPLVGAALALYIPGWNSVVVRALPPNERGEGWGAINTVSGAAIAAGPAIGAFAWDALGPEGPFLLGMLLLLLLLLYYLFFLRRMLIRP